MARRKTPALDIDVKRDGKMLVVFGTDSRGQGFELVFGTPNQFFKTITRLYDRVVVFMQEGF